LANPYFIIAVSVVFIDIPGCWRFWSVLPGIHLIICKNNELLFIKNVLPFYFLQVMLLFNVSVYGFLETLVKLRPFVVSCVCAEFAEPAFLDIKNQDGEPPS
jgi:hypothetical protein